MGLIQGKITMANGAEIPFELYPDEAPITVANFVKLIKEGYYNGKTFHRVIPHFVSQGGCPYGTGAGDLGYTIPCETKNNPHKHVAGAMSMAHRGKDTGCCQFFICHDPCQAQRRRHDQGGNHRRIIQYQSNSASPKAMISGRAEFFFCPAVAGVCFYVYS